MIEKWKILRGNGLFAFLFKSRYGATLPFDEAVYTEQPLHTSLIVLL
jgi:hypothetical protein